MTMPISTKTIGLSRRINGNLDDDLKVTIQDIYKVHKDNILSLNITPIIGEHDGLRTVDEYWIVYVYHYGKWLD